MTKDTVIAFLRASIGESKDKAYLKLTDTDLALYIDIVRTKDSPGAVGFSQTEIPDSAVYGIVLLAKKELYHMLAIASAPEYNIATDGSTLSRKQRFDHYMALIQEVDAEYNNFIAEGGSGGAQNTATSYDVTINRYPYSLVAALREPKPTLNVTADSVTTTAVELSWSMSDPVAFGSLSFYFGTGTLWDEYADSGQELSATAVFLGRINTPLKTKQRYAITAVAGNTYSLLARLQLVNGLYVEKEITFSL